MADRPNHYNGHSLPPCSTLMQGLTKCRASDCNALFSSNNERLQHERHCEIVAHQLFSMGRRPAQYPVQPHRLDVQMASCSIETDSDESSSVVFTPDNSRAPSICDPQERRQSGVIRTIRRRFGSGSSTPETERRRGDAAKPKHIKKQEKEKHNRNQLGSVLYRMEDLFRAYLGWERHEQSGGNGNGAGLHANKSTILRGAEDLLCYFIHREHCWALERGNLDEVQQQLSDILDGAVNAQPYTSTFLATDDEPICAHSDSKSKECIVHGHPDWRECRRLHADPRFAARRNEYLANLGRTRVQHEGYLRSRGSQPSRNGTSSSSQRRA
ncbi:hypothetical protein M409DRAFT_28081 [Zasmidium cellare ATCC 36951]|uniref:Uncharacterized protein n=1 Tax=Zasmidium cellare ATCC 36951 TaxID=1080233 RepID=A0A6A6C3K3_ZASCE|nr:uncharacterized protein M409DRAFT_28081 [Zasmidium cellare ATCC 36951]KAF2161684.1 hypothetical protein M409DRAFT_28081 [Zasmidium cellare ATCC 36951]